MIEWLTMPLAELPVWQFIVIESLIGAGLVWSGIMAAYSNYELNAANKNKELNHD